MDEIKIEPTVEAEACDEQCDDCDCEVVEELLKRSAEVDQAVKVDLVKPAAVKKPATYTAKDGDTWAALGKKFAPKGVKGFDHAKHLMDLNGGKQLTAGAEVVL